MDNILIVSPDRRINSELKNKVTELVNRALDRFKGVISKVEVRYLDTNGPKGGVDTSCTIKIMHKELGQLLIKANGLSFLQATHLACSRAKSMISKRVEFLKTHRVRIEY